MILSVFMIGEFFFDGQGQLFDGIGFFDILAGAHFQGLPDPGIFRKSAGDNGLLPRPELQDLPVGIQPVHAGLHFHVKEDEVDGALFRKAGPSRRSVR